MRIPDQPEQLTEQVRTAAQTWEGVRAELATRNAYDLCYYEGLQWIQRGGWSLRRLGGGSLTRLYTDYNPDSRHLRVVSNMTTTHAIKAAAATFPSALYVDVLPPPGDGGIEQSATAQDCEDALNAIIDASGYVEARRTANFLRVITGTWGVGLCFTPATVRLSFEGQEVTTRAGYMTAFAFDPVRLTLDPGNPSRHLHEHEYVIYSEVWTGSRIERVFGLKLEERHLRPVGELATYEMGMARLSDGRIYAQYARHSRTPGAIVRQVHLRDTATGRFDRMYIGVETAEERIVWLNFDSPQSPFGGDGLPLALYHGHRRPDSPFSIGDVAMIRDAQDRRNLLASVIYRHVQRYAGFQIVYDKRTIPRGMSEEDAHRHLSNTVGGVIGVDMGSRNDNRIPPTLITYPPPQPTMLDMLERTQLEMRDHTFRSEANFGVTKSHVPDSSIQRLLNEADQVLGIRIQEDLTTDDRVLTNMLGTIVLGVSRSDAGILGPLGRTRLDAASYARIMSLDPYRPEVQVKVRESSIRYKSYESKRQDMIEAVRIGTLSPHHLRRAMAIDADSPLIEADRDMARNIRNAVIRIMRGEEWTPMPIGEYGAWFIAECQRALMDAKITPEARERLIRAIQAQQQAEAPPPQERAATEPAPQPATIGDLLAQMQGA